MADELLQVEIEGILAEARVFLKAHDRKKFIATLSRAMARASDL